MNDVRFDPENALTRDGGSRAEVAETRDSPDPEPAADIAERVLDDIAARQTEALRRLARANQTNPLVRRKEHP